MEKFLGKMARMYPLLIVMGFMMVAIAFIVGYFNAQTAAAYFSETKAVRETTLLAQRASIESVALWLPYFKFTGLGLILGGIVMALKVIIDRLKAAGMQVVENLPAYKRPASPDAPWYGKMMPAVMMVGELIFLSALIVSLGLAGTARTLFSNPIPILDAAGSGSALLGQIQAIHATSAWLVPFKFFGIATEFLAIAMGLSTIIYILSEQTEMLDRGIGIARSLTRRDNGEAVAVEEAVHAHVHG